MQPARDSYAIFSIQPDWILKDEAMGSKRKFWFRQPDRGSGENWGILVKRTPKGRTSMIAPSFDHASSLGRELLDDTPGKCRVGILTGNRIGQYAESAPGAIYWDEDDKRAISPELLRPSLAALDNLERENLERIVERVPAGWMSDAARRFAIELTCYNLKQLREIAL